MNQQWEININQPISYRYLYELLGLLQENQKAESDVLWVGNASYQIPWEEFKQLLCKACETIRYLEDEREYIPKDIIVVGQDFLIRLWEYYDADWDPIWEYIPIPAKPQTTVHLQSLMLPKELYAPYPHTSHTLDAQVAFEKAQNHSNR